MTILSDSVLTESKSARDNRLERVSHDSAQDILNKVKALYFALWKGVGAATTETMAVFYEVPFVNIRQLLKTHRDEFESDGLKTLRSKALIEVRSAVITHLNDSKCNSLDTPLCLTVGDAPKRFPRC